MCALHSGLMRRTRNDPFAVDVAVAQLEERSLLIPHDLGSNPSIIDSCTEHLCTNVKKHEAKTEKNECWDQLVGKIMFQISWFCSQTFVLFCLLNVSIKHTKNGQWLWRSWQSSRFRYQRFTVQIQSSAKFVEHMFTVNCIAKKKIKEKEAGKAHLFKK